MPQKVPTALTPWEDRWNVPTLDQLMEPVEANRRRLVKTLIERLCAYEGTDSSLIWHGSSWQWTLQIILKMGSAKPRPFAFVVPNPETPIVCVPLSSVEIDRLPVKRLNRFIREGIRSSKCAVQTHWCKWNPSAGTEVEHLTDLFKRVYKIYSTADQGAAA